MLTNGNWRLEIGDWVKGKSGDGELLRGYVESVNSLQDIVKVRVVACDNEETVGKAVQLLRKWIEKLPASDVNREGHILSLIDVALETRDEQWFLQLSEALRNVQKHTGEHKIEQVSISIPQRRLGASGILE